MQGVGCGVQGVGCRMQGAGCRVQGAGCRVWGVGCGVWGAGLGGHQAPVLGLGGRRVLVLCSTRGGGRFMNAQTRPLHASEGD